MYVTRIPNRNSPPAVLLRESYRGESGTVESRPSPTSRLAGEKIGSLRGCWRGRPSRPPDRAVRDLPGPATRPCRDGARTARRLGPAKALPKGRSARQVNPGHDRARIVSRPPTRDAQRGDRRHVGAVLDLGEVDEDAPRTGSCSTTSPEHPDGGAANWRNSATVANRGDRPIVSVSCARRKAVRSRRGGSKAISAIRARPARSASSEEDSTT